MQTIFIILKKSLLLVGVITLLNFIYVKLIWRDDLNHYAELLPDLWHSEDSADVVYFAESSDFNWDEKDSLKFPIYYFASQYFPDMKFAPVETPAIHARTYSHLISQIKKDCRAKILVVTMNLRSLNADWINSRLETPLMKSEVMYEMRPPIINRFLMSLNAYDNKTEEQREEDKWKSWRTERLIFPYPFKYKNVIEWDSAMAQGTYLLPDGLWDIKKIGLACSYIKTYAFSIDTLTNPRIKDFDKIVKTAKEKNLKLVFNLLSENVHYADSLVGKDLVFLIRQNRDLLMKRYNKDGVVVVDNLELVAGKDFTDQNWTTEHYNQHGRELVAKNLAEHLKEVFRKK